MQYLIIIAIHNKAVLWAAHERKQHHGLQSDKWQQHTSRVRTSLALARSSMPWSDLGAKLRGVHGARQTDLVNVAWAARIADTRGQGKTLAQLKANYWVDLSKTIARRPWSAKLRSFRGRCQLYSFEFDRCLSGSDLMRAYGWPAMLLQGVSQSDLTSSAAEGSSVPLATFMQAVMWSNPFGRWRAATLHGQ